MFDGGRFLGVCFAEGGVKMMFWFKGDSTKGAVRITADKKSVHMFDWKFPHTRKKKKFGESMIAWRSLLIICVCTWCL